MNVREAIRSIIALTGVTNVCSCREEGGGALVQAALAALNRAVQEIWASPTGRHQMLESASLTFSTTAPKDLDANVLNVVGPARWNGYRPLHLCATESEFLNYFRNNQDDHFDGRIWDTLVFASTHNVTGSLPWYNVEFYLPLWDDRAILIYFDNADRINSLNPEAAASPRGNALNSRTILVRVELPHENTHDAACRALVLRELRKKAGEFLECEDDVAGGSIRCFRRRMADVTDWTVSTVANVFLSVTRGPRVPVVAWAEELKLTDDGAIDLARVRLHLLPAATGTVTLKVTREPRKYVFTDLDCEGDGFSSPEIPITHGWAESLCLPIARNAFAQDFPAYLAPQSVTLIPALEAAAAQARVTLGYAAPSASQTVQSTQTTSHAHP